MQLDHSPRSSDRPGSRLVVPNVIRQHAEDAAFVHAARTGLVRMPHVRLRDLRRFDDRLAAHLDGLAVAGEEAWPFCEGPLESPSPGRVFTVAVRAIEERSRYRLDRLMALAEAVPEVRGGLFSAFGWVPQRELRGLVADLLASAEAFNRTVGAVACALHRVDPGLISAKRILDASPLVRERSLRAAGEIGCQEAAPACLAALSDSDPPSRLAAARSLVLLGHRGTALDLVTSAGLAAGPSRLKSFGLALRAMTVGAAHEVLRELAKDPAQRRWLIFGSGIAGDPVYVPWLIDQMGDEQAARLAGEAFVTIAGVDLIATQLEGKKPDGFESGPNNDPDDHDVSADPDDDLPWPDRQRVERWWQANATRFQKGTRYFIGAPATGEQCLAVLKSGYQRQRTAAADYLCLLEPGTPLFNTSAPAWRQQRLLSRVD
jgi:uncharacterized protein (TIGR02270 family)